MTLVSNTAFLTSDWFYLQTTAALKNVFCFERSQPGTRTVSVYTWSLSTQQATCWHHLNCDPHIYAIFRQEMLTLLRSMKKDLHMDFLSTNSSTSYATYSLLSQFYTAWESVCNSQFAKIIQCLCEALHNFYEVTKTLVSQSSSRGHCHGGKRHVIVRDVTTASVELQFWWMK